MIKIFKSLERKDYFIILLISILIALEVFLDLNIPDYMSNITKLIQTNSNKISEILIQGAYMLLCAFGSLISAIIVGYCTSLLSSKFSFTLRNKLFNKVLKFSMSEVKKFSPSSLITRTTNDITQIEMFLAMGLQLLIKAPITAIWAVRKIINKSIEWSLLTGACVLILLIFVIIVLIIIFPFFEKVQKLIDRINSITRENITGIRVIKAFNAENFQKERFEKANNELTNTHLLSQKITALFSPVMNLVMHGLTVGIYIIGVILIEKAIIIQKIEIFSNMVVFTSYGMQVIMAFLMLAMIFMILPRAEVSAKRINEVLEEDVVISDGEFNGKTNEKGTVEFKNVSFKYPDADEYILKDISFKVNQGETVAFIGSTGSGKSTLINLIPRFYDVTEGEILIDGINVKDYKLESLYDKLGYVSQKAVMFTGSINYNVGYGKSPNNKDKKIIKEAINIAQAEGFVLNMDKKYDAHIARGGTNISGGQKQRLSIARAIAKNPEIYIFDDSFSALDYKTDALLRRELKKHTKNATSLIVAQRVGTIMNADKIIVLDNGKCIAMGTHKELLKTCKIYEEIALSQLGKEEL